MNYKNTYRILGRDAMICNDTYRTGLNNNDLIIGPSGAGKTRGYVKPNILQCSESLIVADTKGSLLSEVGPALERSGYRILSLDFKDLDHACGYNPLDFIRYDRKNRQYAPQDILTIANTLVPSTSQKDPFWENAARMYLGAMIGYVMECLPKREHTLKYVVDLYASIQSGDFRKLMNELMQEKPDCFAVNAYRLFLDSNRSPTTEASILSVLGEKLNGLNFKSALKMYSRRSRIDLSKLGEEKTAVFLTISDTDRSMDRLVSLFYTQALQVLCHSADTRYPDHRLPVPVRFILDDFATNAVIPDFDNITSVIRSRNISVSIILQSITQLNAIYGAERAATITNNCDNCLYLGGQDPETARFISVKANKPVSTILGMGLEETYLFTRGQQPRKVGKFDLRQHPRYSQLPESCQFRQAADAAPEHAQEAKEDCTP